jgi:hypothetical protein
VQELHDVKPSLRSFRSGWKFVEESICSLRNNGASVIRLDAFGYFTKKLGTRCFFEVGSQESCMASYTRKEP